MIMMPRLDAWPGGGGRSGGEGRADTRSRCITDRAKPTQKTTASAASRAPTERVNDWHSCALRLNLRGGVPAIGIVACNGRDSA